MNKASNIIIQRLKEYKVESKIEELSAIKEIFQELALFSLARADFFSHGVFLGGTCLRIVHGVSRFSEDLDFSYFAQGQKIFSWDKYFSELKKEFLSHGLQIQLIDRSKATSNIKKAFLKDTSFGKILSLQFQYTRFDPQVVNIKFEIDLNPPGSGIIENKIVNFPYSFPIACFDLSTLFAGKINAILTRGYDKGRDWFDFIWYISKKTPINLKYLQNSLAQFNYTALPIHQPITLSWVKNEMLNKIQSTFWVDVIEDVRPLLKKKDVFALKHWSKDFFINAVQNIEI